MRINIDRFSSIYMLFNPHGPFERTPASRPSNDYYADAVDYADKLLGCILDEVQRLGLAQNTLILYVGDNGSVNRPGGFTINGRKIDGHKDSLRGGGSRVPFVAYWPGVIAPGRVIDDLIDMTDLYPTFLDVAGVSHPADLDGVSFAPQLHGQRGTPREFVEIHLRNDSYRPYDRVKIYEDGRLCDMSQAPYKEVCQ